MPWQPFRRKNKYRHVEHQEEETSFDELLPRSASDGNLLRWGSDLHTGVDRMLNIFKFQDSQREVSPPEYRSKEELRYLLLW